MSASRPFAIVTGASSGIGRELAKVCAREGFDLLIAADEPEIENAAEEMRALVGNDMRRRNAGRIMIVGSIAGFVPGSFQAVYNGTKAFLDSFSFALREELRGSKVTVTCLMPGATETKFFERAEMLDTSVGTAKKASAADVARTGFAAMMRGDGDIVSGFKNKLQSAVAQIIPAGVLARQHRKYAEPGSARS